jgi:hypothetical protein
LYYKKETDIQPAGKVYFSSIEKILKGDKFDTEFRLDILCVADNMKKGRDKRKFCLRAYTKAEGESWYNGMVNVALGKERQSTLNTPKNIPSRPSFQTLPSPNGGGNGGNPMKKSPSRQRRQTEFKADSKLLGKISVYEELVTNDPVLGSVYRARMGTG